jgi:DNA-binding transcriptional ArsR family regulator
MMESIALAHALVHENRFKIVDSLLEKPRHISALATKVGIDRATLCYHLNLLERVGLVESDYVILEQPRSKGKAGRVYKVNKDRLQEAIKEITEEISSLT